MNALKLSTPCRPPIKADHGECFARNFGTLHRLDLCLPNRQSASLAVKSHNGPYEPSLSSNFTAAVGSPPSSLRFSKWNITHRHITMLNIVACATAISATWLFCSAIPTVLAFKRAAESLEKLLDVTREELPDTMAAVRLSGMEINDLTMELSDLGQEITQGVRNSTRAAHLAEERLRRLANMTPTGAGPRRNQSSRINGS